MQKIISNSSNIYQYFVISSTLSWRFCRQVYMEAPQENNMPKGRLQSNVAPWITSHLCQQAVDQRMERGSSTGCRRQSAWEVPANSGGRARGWLCLSADPETTAHRHSHTLSRCPGATPLIPGTVNCPQLLPGAMSPYNSSVWWGMDAGRDVLRCFAAALPRGQEPASLGKQKQVMATAWLLKCLNMLAL